jgi:hypothetical protein
MELSLADGPAGSLPGVDPVMDPESRAWVAALAGQGGDREAALGRLHALLLRAARFERAVAGASWPACRRPSATTWPLRRPTTP